MVASSDMARHKREAGCKDPNVSKASEFIIPKKQRVGAPIIEMMEDDPSLPPWDDNDGKGDGKSDEGGATLCCWP
jgi:hypothetical protein